MKKRILSLVLTGALCLSTAAPALAAGLDNFGKVNTYTAGQFTDIPADAWFTPNVQAAYELDLMTGSSATTFNPNGNLTIAEALVLACRLHSTYVGDGETFAANGGTWYQPYVDYAVASGIIAANAYTDYTATATRAQFAAILAAALPDEALPAINSVTSLPDLDASAAYAAAVLKLYNAGILTGSDSAGSFKPASTIQRSEVATIVARMADKSLRKTFTLSEAASTPSVSSSTRKFDGMLTADDLQGVWYAHRDPSTTSIVSSFQFDNEEEWTFNGDQFIYAVHRLKNDTYYYLTGTFTMTSAPYNGDPNICSVTLNLKFGDCYMNDNSGEPFYLNDVYSNTTSTRTLNANLTFPYDCFVYDGSTFTRADAQTIYPAYVTVFNELGVREPEPDMPDTDYVLYDGLPVPDFGALYGVSPKEEEESDIRLPGEWQATIDAAEALTADMITFEYSAKEVQETADLLMPPATDPFFFTDYEAVLEECGFKGEYRNTYGGRQFFYVGYGYLVSYDVIHIPENYHTFDLPQRYNSDTIVIRIQPD